MPEDTPTEESSATDATAEKPPSRPRKRTAKKAAAAPDRAVDAAEAGAVDGGAVDASAPPRKRAPRKKASAAAPKADEAEGQRDSAPTDSSDAGDSPLPPARKRTPKKSSRAKAPSAEAAQETPTGSDGGSGDETASTAIMPIFQAPDPVTSAAPKKKSSKSKKKVAGKSGSDDGDTGGTTGPSAEESAGNAGDERAGDAAAGDAAASGDDTDEAGGARRRRRRGGRRRRKSGDSGGDTPGGDSTEEQPAAEGSGQGSGPAAGAAADADTAEESTGTRRRRRRRRGGGDDGDGDDDSPAKRGRRTRSAEDEITAVSGSTRLEAKKQRRREGREAGRRRAPIVSEAEFLARRESVERVMVIRQREDLTQIAVLEDKVLVEHYVARESQTSLIGNVYLGRVQNVLPSMEAAFIDIGKGRNGVLYAGEVNWSALGHKDGQPRKIESVLSSGQPVLVQATKDPLGHKGARLTSQISLAGRFLVYVPDGNTSGISRKLPDTERSRLKSLLKEIVPETAGVIVRTAAEGASEDELTRDVERLKARWEDIEKKAANKGAGAQLLYGEPDLTLKVVRDLFTEDFTKLVIEGDEAWETVSNYVAHVAPDLEGRLERFDAQSQGDSFSAYRIDEQIHKGLDRKVWLPSGGSLVIDRTEAMTVVDVNTGKFTGSGGNLEETVTKNNLEAAEEIVRQLRLRDIGGIIVVDFIDMVLESNRDLVLRRLVECLGRDRTRHQVAEVTSLGLVQMTRKRIGTGLLEAFSHTCEQCGGRGVITTDAPVEAKRGPDDDARRGRRRSGRGRNGDAATPPKPLPVPSPKDLAAAPRHDPPAEPFSDTDTETDTDTTESEARSDVDSDVRSDAQSDAQSDTQSDTQLNSEAASQGDSAAESTVDDAQPAPESEPEPAPEPDAQPESGAEPEAEPESPAPVERPKVVTRTRRRSASRPAGPPVIAEESASGSNDGAPDDAGAAAGETHDDQHPTIEHVPIKKRGSRKR